MLPLSCKKSWYLSSSCKTPRLKARVSAVESPNTTILTIECGEWTSGARAAATPPVLIRRTTPRSVANGGRSNNVHSPHSAED